MGRFGEGEKKDGGGAGRKGKRRTESVHLNCPTNILVSEVVIRRVLLRRDRR